MRRFDYCTWAFFARPAEESARVPQRYQDSEPPEDAREEPINSWETAWIDLGGEG